MAQKPRAPSPSAYDDVNDISNDSIMLDPELDLIAKQSRANYRGSSAAQEDSSNDTVEITVKWQPHPQFDGAGDFEASVFKMNRVRL